MLCYYIISKILISLCLRISNHRTIYIRDASKCIYTCAFPCVHTLTGDTMKHHHVRNTQVRSEYSRMLLNA